MWTLITGLVVAVSAGLLARELKISEFRQKWIDELRIEISEYLSASELWFRLYQGYYEQFGPKTLAQLREADDAANKALTILYRIRMRIKPESQSDDLEKALLKSLPHLIDPMSWIPNEELSSWRRRADEVVATSRDLLKREWDVTKEPWRRWRWPGRSSRQPEKI